jgi:hypothetical protein
LINTAWRPQTNLQNLTHTTNFYPDTQL